MKRGSVEGFHFVTEKENNALGTFLWKATNPYFIEYELELLRSAYQELRADFDHWWLEENANEKLIKMALQGICTRMFLPALPQAMARVMIGDARHRLCRLAIAVRSYELERGELPESFDDLKPTYIEEVPLDPSTDKPFKMENVAGGVRLYSAAIEAWDPNEYPVKHLRNFDGKVEMFLKSRKQADN